MKKKPILSIVIAAMVCGSTLSLWAQGSTPAPQAPSTPSASQGSATIQNQMMAYDVLRRVAVAIANRTASECLKINKAGSDSQPTCNVLLNDPNAQSEIVTANAFDQSVTALKNAYDNASPKAEAPSLAPVSIGDIASLLTAIKSTATVTNQNFQPTTQSMTTLLSIALNQKNVALRTSTLPGNLKDASQRVQDKLGEIAKARQAAQGRIQDQQSKNDAARTDNKKKQDDREKELKEAKDEPTRERLRAKLEQLQADQEALDATKAQLAKFKASLDDLDKEFSALRTSLTAASPDGTILATIIKGKALLKALGDPDNPRYSVLTVSIDAAGGDTKITHFFWRELFWPTANPSYNGGAVVSFLLTDQDGNFQDGDQFRFVYDFSKWKTEKVPQNFNSELPKLK